jgi:endonuclease/exonuclease/phosphatase (EEP) superfamily protein YafD
MRAARLAIDRWRSPAHRMQPPGEGASDFPAPDLVAGDFNTPRGSGSLTILVGPMREAHTAAGFGPGNTWRTPADWSRRRVPAWLSLATRWTGRWPIDLVFASDRWRVTRIQHTPKPDALHTLQVVDLEPGRP